MQNDGVRPLSLKKNMIWNSVGSLTNMICQWAITVLVVRLSTDYEVAGIYSLAVSVFTMFSQVAQYRTYTIQVSDVDKQYSAGEYLAFRFVTCGIALCAITIYALVTCRSNSWLSIFLFSLYKIAGLAIDVFHASDQVAHRMDFIGKSLILQGAGSLLSFVLVFSLSQSLNFTLAAMLASTIGVGLLFDSRKTAMIANLKPTLSVEKAKTLLVRCAPVVVAGIACSAASSIPRQYLSQVAGDSALGIYTSVAAPVAVIQMGASYIYNPLMSYFSEAYAKKDRTLFGKLMAGAVLGISLVGVLCSILLNWLGEPLLVLVYGSSIASYVYLLQPLVVCAILTGMTWFLNDLLIALRNFRATFIGSVVALIASLVSLVWAQSSFGLNGVTVSTVISCVAALVFMGSALMLQLRRSSELMGE